MQESKYRCINVYAPNNEYERVKFISALPSIINDSDEEDTCTLGKKGCYTPGWCVFFVIISISSVREV